MTCFGVHHKSQGCLKNASWAKDFSWTAGCCEQQAREDCKDEAADDMKYDYGCSTETGCVWRRSIGRETSTTPKEMSVDMIVRRPLMIEEHTCLYTLVSCSFNVGSYHFSQIPD